MTVDHQSDKGLVLQVVTVQFSHASTDNLAFKFYNEFTQPKAQLLETIALF